MKGFLFGFTDNLIVAISALAGIQIEKHFFGMGKYGALYGALLGHTLSDMFAGYLDFGYSVALNMGLGCLTVVVLVYLYIYFTDNYKKNKDI
tara:strand:+ start:846 stop:1121 length:276 start_codon:yes stop_codon:yes gene_type:complete